ncbi:hypothetical protein T492DRAFT_908357 [Pavlovales sp. CCMP2436]|nr:hypothetical protein T492DRAFT_908357 [Pavlovales sp. CCMP2436]
MPPRRSADAIARSAKETFARGTRLFNGDGLPVDHAEGARLYHIAADLGKPLYNEEAAHYFRLAADQGFADAQSDQDYHEAARWFQLAADQGIARAQYSLGRCYFAGNDLMLGKMLFARERIEALAALLRHADQLEHLLRTHRPLVRTALHIPPDGAVALRNYKVVHRVLTNTWSVIRWQYN